MLFARFGLLSNMILLSKMLPVLFRTSVANSVLTRSRFIQAPARSVVTAANLSRRSLALSRYISAAPISSFLFTNPIGIQCSVSKFVYSTIPITPSSEEEKEKQKQKENQIRATKWSLITVLSAMLGGVVFAITEWGPPQIDNNGNVVEDEFSKEPAPKQYLLRCWKTAWQWNEGLKDPIRDVLLPDPLQAPYMQPEYTLVIESNGILMHPDWTFKTGWRFKKRPFVEYLLQQCRHPLFEIVIFTKDQGLTADPLLQSLDPNGNIMYKLFRDSTRYQDGVRIKDLSCLNRDLSKVIVIDCEEEACKLNRQNCLILKKWEGTDGDKTLFELAQFLRAVAVQEVSDVREVIAYYNQFDDPLEAFKDRQRQLLEHEEQQQVPQPSRLSSMFKRK